MTPSEQPTPNPFGIVDIGEIDWDNYEIVDDEELEDDYPFDDEEEAGDLSW